MAAIKNFTSLNQSKELAKILPPESADQSWASIGIDIPCWSLAALLKTLNFPSLTQNKEDEWEVCVFDHDNDSYIEKTASNPVDVCVAMIEKLYELKLL